VVMMFVEFASMVSGEQNVRRRPRVFLLVMSMVLAVMMMTWLGMIILALLIARHRVILILDATMTRIVFAVAIPQ